MYYKQIKKLALFFLLVETIGEISAQSSLKVGENQNAVNKNTVLEIESTTKGFLPPRMTKTQRDAIVSPPAGLQVWCTNCNISTEPVSGEFCIYLGTGWVPLLINTIPIVTTGRKADADGPVWTPASSVTIKGTLVNSPGAPPVETGVVWREITGGDFASLPVLDASGSAAAPNYKMQTGVPVTADGGVISASIAALSSTTSFTRPYYFRTYAKNPLGIGYGNPVIFNFAPPVISVPDVVNGSTFSPSFSGTLTVNAGTPQGIITEYGYCSSKTNNPPTTADNKVVLSTSGSLASLNTKLNSETFTADPLVDLAVNNYSGATAGAAYFCYYVIANGVTLYSSAVTFNPVVDIVTGGSAVAAISAIDPISAPLKIGTASTSSITVHFSVTKAGSYDSFVPNGAMGNTTGLTLSSIAGGNFALGAQSLVFLVTGTPESSLDGNSFIVPRIGTLSTGAVQPADVNDTDAVCDGVVLTSVVPVTSKTGKIWMDRNLGAGRAAIAVDDYKGYGCLYQWGRGNDGHASIIWNSSGGSGTPVNGTTYTKSVTDTPGDALFVISSSGGDWRSTANDALWQGVNGINNPCPTGYRLPTMTEYASEVTAYNITNAAAAYASPFKFTVLGFREYTGNLNYSLISGFYWSGSVTISGYGGFYAFHSDSVGTGGSTVIPAMGYAV